MKLHPQVEQLTEADEVLLWHRLTGRHARLHADTLAQLDLPALAPVRARLLRLHMLGDFELNDLIPVRRRLVLTLPDRPALWLPVPDYRSAGGHGYRMRPLSIQEHAIWRAINDHRSITEVHTKTGLPLPTIHAFLHTLCARNTQAIELRDVPLARRDAGLIHLVRPPRPASPRGADQRGPDGQTTLLDYHLDGITDGAHHFDDTETTFAHVFEDPHPALGGQRFGDRLFDALAERGLVPDGRAVLVEIGGGTGAVAACWAERITAARPQLSYLRVDLSPELLRTQAARVPQLAGMVADCTRLPLRDQSVDFILANEVIADLSAAPFTPTGHGSLHDTLAERLDRYGLPALQGLYNLGAWQLLEEMHRVLAPDGVAYLSEFGDEDRAPEEAVQLDHPEVSIHFGQLSQVAHVLGFELVSLPLGDLLRVDWTHPWLARHSWEALRALARSEGRHLAARAYTPKTLTAALPWRVQGLDWVPLSEPGPGPLLTRFHCLLLRRKR